MFSSLPWAAGPSGGGFVLCLFCLPFGFLFVYFLCMIWNLRSWVSLLIYLLFIDQKKKREVQCWEKTPRSTLTKYQLEQRNRLRKINDTRIYMENSFTGEKSLANQDKIHYIINLYNYIDFHQSPHRKPRPIQEKIQTRNNQVFTTIQR